MKPSPAWRAQLERLPRSLVHPPALAPGPRWLVICGVVAGLGVLDYFAGAEISLAVFYLVPIVLATAWCGRRAGWLAAALALLSRLLGDGLIVYPATLPTHIWWNASAGLCIYLLVVWLVHALLTLQRGLEGVVEERTGQLRESDADRERLQRELLEVAARERNTFGRELHDDLGQHLVATAMAAQVLAQKSSDPTVARDARQIAQWIEVGIAKTRRLARGLLLARIEPAQFCAELEELAASATGSGIACRTSQQGAPVDLSASECAQLFRIAQEAVSNALRHARATTIDITVACDERAVCLFVNDDGVGMPATREGAAGMGLRIMEHRARFIGASFSLHSAAGEGTRIVCRVPRRNSPA